MENEKLVIRPKHPRGEDGHRTFSIRIKDELADRINGIAAQTGRSRNEIISLFLEFALERCSVSEK